MTSHVARRTRWLVAPVVGAVVSATLAAPPRVVTTSPVTGDEAVDPRLGEIRVEFDRAMSRGSYSWTGAGPSFPATAGRPRWEGDRVCVLPVELEPGRLYQLGINGGRATGFRGADGSPADSYPLIFRTAGGEAPAPLDPAEVRQGVDRLRAAVNDRYSYRDRTGLDWDARFREHRASLESADTALRFALSVRALLAPTRDPHLWIDVGDVRLGMPWRGRPANFNGRVLDRIVPGLARRNGAVITGRFDDGIGYLLITTWDRGAEKDLDAIQEVVTGLIDAPGLVIDVRPNGGGDERLARAVAGRFLEEPVVYAKHDVRDPSASGGFTPVVSRTLSPTRGAPRYAGPVCVLMGPANMSSCEAFLLMMRQTPRCTLVGDRSTGSSGNPQPYELLTGVTVMLPSWRAMDAEGRIFEGVGLEPDVLVEAGPRAFADGDPVLARALEILRGGSPEP